MGDLLIQNFTIIAQIMNVFSLVAGICLVLLSILEFRRLGEQRSMMSQQHPATRPTVLLLCGAMLLILPNIATTALMAFWGQASDLAYPGGATGYSALMPAVIVFVRIIGLASFIRGIIMLSRVGSQQSQPGIIGKALIHIFAGILCLHIVDTTHLIGSVLGIV